jgi:hypothetical protein
MYRRLFSVIGFVVQLHVGLTLFSGYESRGYDRMFISIIGPVVDTRATLMRAIVLAALDFHI